MLLVLRIMTCLLILYVTGGNEGEGCLVRINQNAVSVNYRYRNRTDCEQNEYITISVKEEVNYRFFCVIKDETCNINTHTSKCGKLTIQISQQNISVYGKVKEPCKTLPIQIQYGDSKLNVSFRKPDIAKSFITSNSSGSLGSATWILPIAITIPLVVVIAAIVVFQIIRRKTNLCQKADTTETAEQSDFVEEDSSDQNESEHSNLLMHEVPEIESPSNIDGIRRMESATLELNGTGHVEPKAIENGSSSNVNGMQRLSEKSEMNENGDMKLKAIENGGQSNTNRMQRMESDKLGMHENGDMESKASENDGPISTYGEKRKEADKSEINESRHVERKVIDKIPCSTAGIQQKEPDRSETDETGHMETKAIENESSTSTDEIQQKESEKSGGNVKKLKKYFEERPSSEDEIQRKDKSGVNKTRNMESEVEGTEKRNNATENEDNGIPF